MRNATDWCIKGLLTGCVASALLSLGEALSLEPSPVTALVYLGASIGAAALALFLSGAAVTSVVRQPASATG